MGILIHYFNGRYKHRPPWPLLLLGFSCIEYSMPEQQCQHPRGRTLEDSCGSAPNDTAASQKRDFTASSQSYISKRVLDEQGH
jgi:hypothetical protein